LKSGLSRPCGSERIRAAITQGRPRATEVYTVEMMADRLDQLGGISPKRVVMRPAPGQATEEDLLRLMAETDRLYELVDGTLVEKPVGYTEGFLAADIVRLLGRFLDKHDLGDVGGADAPLRLLPGLVRLPDVVFVRWGQYPNRQRPTEPIAGVYPDLAVEVLSKSNTRAEMKRKRKEYFLAGTRLVWEVDPVKRTIDVYMAPDKKTTLAEGDTLDGGAVLPGLALPVADVFARVPRPAKKAPRRKKKN
jgi:Uma2 family endonuclease